MARLVVQNIGKLYTLAGFEGTSGKIASSLYSVAMAELVLEDGIVTYAGPSRAALDEQGASARESNPYPSPPEVVESLGDSVSIDAHGALVTPGLVDPHTHLVYGGNRAHEMSLKLAGVPYLDILSQGGGILSTVRATHEASDEELLESASVRLRAMLAMGTTTVEIKSGYGLSTEEELRLLQIVAELDRRFPSTIVPTLLGAHAIPPRFKNDPDAYVDEIVERMIPAVAREGLATFCDVFCETGIFSVEQSRRILQAGKDHGLLPKLHADEIEAPSMAESGARLAAEIGAVSADHLRETADEGFRGMAQAGVVPVALPATSFSLRDHRYANVRKMIDEFDLPVALATDDNPGTSPTESLQIVMALGALELKMTPEEILAGVSVNAARAVAMNERVGTLEEGKLGDAVIWQAYNLNVLSYRFGVNQAAMVIKAGEIVSPRL